jgi:hypothetical protein
VCRDKPTGFNLRGTREVREYPFLCSGSIREGRIYIYAFFFFFFWDGVVCLWLSVRCAAVEIGLGKQDGQDMNLLWRR